MSVDTIQRCSLSTHMLSYNTYMYTISPPPTQMLPHYPPSAALFFFSNSLITSPATSIAPSGNPANLATFRA